MQLAPMLLIHLWHIFGLYNNTKQLQNNMFKFNQQFRKYQRNGANDYMILSYLDKQMINFRFQLNYSYQNVSENYAKKINALYDIIYDNSKEFGKTVGKETFCTNRQLNINQSTLSGYLFQVLQAYQFINNNSEDIFLQSSIKETLEKTANQIEQSIFIKPEIVQFTSLTKGNIYQLRQLNQNDNIERFNDMQANGYNQNQPWFKDFFGTANDDILIIVDCSNIYSNQTRQSIQFTVQQFLQQISSKVNIKLALLAEDIVFLSQGYINLEVNKEVINQFLNKINTIDIGKHIPQNFLQQIIRHEIQHHNLYHSVNSYEKFQPFKLLNVYVFIGSLFSSDQYQLQQFSFDVMVTFIKYQKNFVTLKDGVNINLQQRIKNLALFIKQSNVRFILIHSTISDYLQSFYQKGIQDYITIYCNATVMPWYYSFCDNLNILNQQNRELIVLLSVQQILENLQPNEDQLMITNVTNLTLFSVPVYVNTTKGMYYLAGIYTAAINIDKLFKSRREIMQHGNVVSISHDIGEILKPELIIPNENNTQFVLQDQYLYVVDTLMTDSKFQLRATYVMDQVLNYSNDQFYVTTLKAEDCLRQYVKGYVMCLVSHTQEFYFNRQITYNFYLLVNESIVDEGVLENQTIDEQREVILQNIFEILNHSSYNTQLRLIASFIGNDEYFANNLNSNMNYYEYQINPHLICSIDKCLCGFSNMKIINSAHVNLIIQRLLDLQESNKNSANHTNYTQVMFIPELQKLYVIQRHYFSVNVMKLYANSTFLLRLVGVPMPDIQQLFLTNCSSQSPNIQQSVYFINYDGDVQYQISCEQNKVIHNTVRRHVENDADLIDLYLILLNNKLFNRTNKTIEFLGSQFKNHVIYLAKMLMQLNGTAVYQQFEGSLLMIAIQLEQQDITEYKIILQQSYERNMTELIINNTSQIISSFEPIYNFEQYLKRTPFKNEFDLKAKQFYLENQHYFQDQQQDVNVFEFPTVHVVMSLISIAMLLILFFI